MTADRAAATLDFFADPYGSFRPDERLLSRLVLRYPRRLGGPLERLYDLRLAALGIPWRLARAAARQPERRRVLVVGVEVDQRPEWMARVRQALAASRHDVTVAVKGIEGRPRIENLNILLRQNDYQAFDWVIVTDDDIALPAGFTDRFLHLLERFGLLLGQPAHNLVSYASYEVNRRAWGTVARRTGFVEVGPLVAFHRSTFPTLLPFPEVGMGHGLDVHWAHLAARMGWRIGVVDALPIRHLRPVADSYDRGPVRRAALDFIAAHGGLPRREALRTIETFRGL